MTAALRLDSLTESQARILGDCFGTTLERIDGSAHRESPYVLNPLPANERGNDSITG